MPDLVYEVSNHLTCITMSCPEHLNCFNEEMIQLWVTALGNTRDRDDIHIVLLLGNGRAFYAEGGIKVVVAGEGFFENNNDIIFTALARKNALRRGIQCVSLILEEVDKPVTAKIHGVTVGAGLDMTLMCDIHIASESASFPESYSSVGIASGDGGAYLLPHLMGRDKALDLFLMARVLRDAKAEKIGPVVHVVPDDQLDDYAEQYTQRLTDVPQQAMWLTKRAIDQSEQSSLRSSLDLVSSSMGIVTEPDDYHTQTAVLVEHLNRKSKA